MGLPSPYEPGLKFQPYKEARVTVTSEENAYGQTSKRWFDGVAKSSLIKSEGLVRVNDMTEYHNIYGTCSHESYYECLTKRFLEFDYLQYSKKNKSATVSYVEYPCDFSTEICTPYSLPAIGNRTIPICHVIDCPKQ